MTLSFLECKNLKPKEKPYKKGAGKGLYLHIMPNGAKYWRMKYRFAGKEKIFSIGVFPDVLPKEADEKCRAAHKLLEQNIDPNQAKTATKRNAEISAENTFEVIARELA